jgi:hypothetical protein
MRIKKIYIVICLISLFGYAISLDLLQNYTLGDQIYYHSFYKQIAGLSLGELGTVAGRELGSSEPLTWLVLWMGSNLGIDKDVWISLLNVLLMTSLYFLLMVTSPA